MAGKGQTPKQRLRHIATTRRQLKESIAKSKELRRQLSDEEERTNTRLVTLQGLVQTYVENNHEEVLKTLRAIKGWKFKNKHAIFWNCPISKAPKLLKQLSSHSRIELFGSIKDNGFDKVVFAYIEKYRERKGKIVWDDEAGNLVLHVTLSVPEDYTGVLKVFRKHKLTRLATLVRNRIRSDIRKQEKKLKSKLKALKSK